RMHAAGRNQADQVAGAAAALKLADQIDQRRSARDLAACDGVADARQVLYDDPAGADIEMADLGIAHLPVWEADVAARRAQQGMRARRPEAVECRCSGETDGVVGALLAPAPAVQHDQHHRTAFLHRLAPSSSADNEVICERWRWNR